MIRQLCFATLFAAAGYLASPAAAQTLIFDSFESDTSSGYTIVDDGTAGASGDGAADSTSEFAFNYVGAGIPLAPRSEAGDVGGLRLTVNATEEGAEGATSTEEDHITAFNNVSVSGNYRLDVDIYMGVDPQQPGTTEFAHVGIGATADDFLSIFTPIVDNGYFVSITGEGGSSSDYRHSQPGNPAVPSGDPSYLNDLNTTNATAQLYQDLYPNTEFPGSPTNIWTTLTITSANGIIQYSLDGVPIIATAASGSSDGLAGLGYTDPFDSVGPHFVIYDNLTVETIPEPSSLLIGLGLIGGVAAGRRRS